MIRLPRRCVTVDFMYMRLGVDLRGATVNLLGVAEWAPSRLSGRDPFDEPRVVLAVQGQRSRQKSSATASGCTTGSRSASARSTLIGMSVHSAAHAARAGCGPQLVASPGMVYGVIAGQRRGVVRRPLCGVPVQYLTGRYPPLVSGSRSVLIRQSFVNRAEHFGEYCRSGGRMSLRSAVDGRSWDTFGLSMQVSNLEPSRGLAVAREDSPPGARSSRCVSFRSLTVNLRVSNLEPS